MVTCGQQSSMMWVWTRKSKHWTHTSLRVTLLQSTSPDESWWIFFNSYFFHIFSLLKTKTFYWMVIIIFTIWLTGNLAWNLVTLILKEYASRGEENTYSTTSFLWALEKVTLEKINKNIKGAIESIYISGCNQIAPVMQIRFFFPHCKK